MLQLEQEFRAIAFYVWVENNIMNSANLDRALRITSNPIRGGVIEHVYMRNIEVIKCKEAVFRVEMKYEKVTEGPYMPFIQDVQIYNVTSGGSQYGVWIDGIEPKTEDELLQVYNVTITDCSWTNVSKQGILIAGASNVVFQNVFINNQLVVYDENKAKMRI